MPIMPRRSHSLIPALKVGVVAGLVGGAAEIAWVAAYGTFADAAGADAAGAEVARGVTHALLPALAGSALAVPLGIALHMALAGALGIALALALGPLFARPRAAPAGAAAVIVALIAVWAVNFFVVLPALDPSFLRLLPLAVTLVSKTLFGVAAAAVFARARSR